MRKVLLLVAIQLLITTGVSVAFFTIQPIKARTPLSACGLLPVWLHFSSLFTSAVQLEQRNSFRAHGNGILRVSMLQRSVQPLGCRAGMALSKE